MSIACSPSPKAPSVKDVARLAEVSVGTVSNVLNGRSSVRPDIRERVEMAIADLSYVPNPTAQALRTGISPLVGVAVLDLANPFFMEAATGMERRLYQDGCIMALSSTHSDVEEEARLLRALAGQGVRGILLTPTDSSLEVALEVVSRGVPVVLFDSPATPKEMSSICVDDRAGAALAAQHLLSLGHRHIALLNGPRRVRQARDRLAGVEKAMEEVGRRKDLTVYEFDAFTAEAGRSGVRAMLAGAGVLVPGGAADPPAAHALIPPTLPPAFPTAFLCTNDLIAFGAMTALRDAGVRVPEDVSLIGFDDVPVASQMSVPLTTIRQPMAELGWASADILLRNPDNVQHQRFYPELVTRSSTAGPRS